MPLYWSHFASYRVLDRSRRGYAAGDDDRGLGGARRRRRDGGLQALKTNLLVPGLASGLPPTLDGAIDRCRINAAVEFVGALRDRVGPRWASSSTSARNTAMAGSSSSARALEPFDLYWLEAEGFDPDALLAARRQTRTRLCHGEALIRREEFRPFLERHVTDVVMVETLNERPHRGAPDRRARGALRHDGPARTTT